MEIDKNENNAGIDAFDLPPVSEEGAGFIEDLPTSDVESENNPHDTPENDAPATPTLLQQGEKYRGTLSRQGEPYDPSLHQIPPSETKGGHWRKMSPKQRKEIHGQQAEKGEAPDITNNAAFRRSAAKYAALYGNAHMIPFGARGGAIEKATIMPLVDDLERYLMETGAEEMSPGWAVLFSAVTYSVSVATRETNREKLARWFSPITSWFNRLLGRDDETQPDASEVKNA